MPSPESSPRLTRALLAVGHALALCACTHPVTVQSHEALEPAPTPPRDVLATNTPLMPQAVTSFGASVFEGAIYTLGGYAGVPHAYSREGQSGAFRRFDVARGTWEELAQVERVQGPALVSVPDGVVRIGGMRARNAQGAPEDLVSVDEVALFVPREGRFRALAPLDKGRSSHAAAAIGARVYVVGGWTLSGGKQSGTFAPDMVSIDTARGEVRVHAQPFQRRALAAGVLDGKLVVIGGLGADGKISQEVWVYSPDTDQWTKAADFPGDGFGLAAASDGDALTVSDRSGALHRLATVDGAWTKLGRLTYPRFFHQLVQVDAGHVAALGGISGMHMGARIRPIELIDVAKPAPRSLTFELSAPTRAKNRQGTFVVGDSLYVFGGNRSLAQHDFAPEDFVSEAARVDLADLSVHTLAPFPVARQTVQTNVDDESVYALGGFGHDGQRARTHAEAFRYDLDSDSYTPDPQVLDTPRTQFGLITYGGARWVFGGLDFDPARGEEKQFVHPLEVLKADPGAPFRPSGIVLPHPRRAFGGALLGDRYYMVGGMAEGFAAVDGCDVLDLKTGQWADFACPPARVSPQLVALDGALYLAGGSVMGQGGLVPAPSLERYDPASNRWTTVLDALPIGATHLAMQPFHDALLLYSAQQEDARIKVALVVPE